MLRTLGIASLAVALLAIFPSLVSGAGALLALIALPLAGISAIHGERRYAWATMAIVTLDLGLVSVLPELQNTSRLLLAMLVGIPYLLALIFILVGLRRERTGQMRG